MLEAVEVASETDLRVPTILRVDVQMRELSIDFLDQPDKLLFGDEDQGLGRVVKRPDVIPVSMSGPRSVC